MILFRFLKIFELITLLNKPVPQIQQPVPQIQQPVVINKPQVQYKLHTKHSKVQQRTKIVQKIIQDNYTPQQKPKDEWQVSDKTIDEILGKSRLLNENTDIKYKLH